MSAATGPWSERKYWCAEVITSGDMDFYCELPDGPHPDGLHRSPGLDEGDPDFTWLQKEQS